MNSTQKIPIQRIADFYRPALIREIQDALCGLGFLDPVELAFSETGWIKSLKTSDGDFGPLSQLAWRHAVFHLMPAVAPDPDHIDEQKSAALISAWRSSVVWVGNRNPMVQPGDDLAGRIWRTLRQLGHWLPSVPGWPVIVYLEGADRDGNPNGNPPNQFNDQRLVLTLRHADGPYSRLRPEIAGQWEATTEPGRYYTEQPLNPRGAARIAFGQYRAWAVGMHGRGASRHQALVQCGPIPVHRDLNRDYLRAGDAIETGSGFGINQHHGYNLPVEDIGRASAGCLVGRRRIGHEQFMQLVTADPRYQATHRYRFLTSILSAEKLLPPIS